MSPGESQQALPMLYSSPPHKVSGPLSPWGEVQFSISEKSRGNCLRWFFFAALLIWLALILAAPSDLAAPAAPARQVILFVWDGLRPDSINLPDTPNLYRLSKEGATFVDHHSTYPTFTMMNAASLATGAYPGRHGFYGNTLYEPGLGSRNSQGDLRTDGSGKKVDFGQPVFTEDYSVLRQLNDYYRTQGETRGLLLAGTLFQAAHKAHLETVAVGKPGPAFLQDLDEGNAVFLDEKVVYPLTFARSLQDAKIPLPASTPYAYCKGDLILNQGNGEPTNAKPIITMRDGVTPDPSAADASPYKQVNDYLMGVYLEKILPMGPAISVIWLRNPDTTEHNYGPGSKSYHAALRAQDELLGKLLDRIERLGMKDRADLIVVSDHGHSSVSGPREIFPLREIKDGTPGDVAAGGFSVSGEVRTADLLARNGFKAYDGHGCLNDPVLSGIFKDDSAVYKGFTDSDGKTCRGDAGKPYTTRSYMVPDTGPPAGSLVVAPNGGSEYIYIPDHDPALASRVVKFLQGHDEYGPIFVDDRYSTVIPGVLTLSDIRAQNSSARNPDLIVSFAYDAAQIVRGMKGSEFASMQANPYRGMHGSFSPVDVHNTLVAIGPDFKPHFTDPLPTANVDVAPTIARILNFPLPEAQGRPLLEALTGGPAPASVQVTGGVLSPRSRARGLSLYGPAAKEPRSTDGTYTIVVRTKSLRQENRNYTYYDSAWAIRH